MVKLAMQAAKKPPQGTGTHRVAQSEGEAAIRLLNERGYPSKRRQNGQSEHRCPFHEEPGDLRKGDAKFYVDVDTSKFYCHSASCGAKGNLVTLERQFGVDPEYSGSIYVTKNDELKKWERHLEAEPSLKQVFHDHGLDDDTIKRFRFGYDPEKKRYVIPYLDGKTPLAFRFYNPDPQEYVDAEGKTKKQLKYYWETGASAALYNLNDAGGDAKGRVFVCEGELKAAALVQMGYSAVATPGAGMLKEEWHKHFSDARQIIVLFDNDDPEHPKNQRDIEKCQTCKRKELDACEGHNAGQDAAAKVVDALGWRATNLVLPVPSGEPKTDVNEYFTRDGHTASEFAEWALGEKAEPYKVQTFAEIMADPPEKPAMLVEQGILPSQGRLLIAGKPKVGKLARATTSVLTPYGWTTMGAIRPNDEVIGSDGRPVKVTHIHPQGVKPIYRVTMSDGTSTECGWEHLWNVQTHNDREYEKKDGRPRWRTMQTSEIAALLDEGKTRHTYMPMVEPVEYAPVGPLPIDAYALGLLLGDGGISVGTPDFVKPDEELHEAIEKAVAPLGCSRSHLVGHVLRSGFVGRGMGHENPLTRELRTLGLWGCRSWEKFIPEIYLRAPIEDRLALIQGLCDTDGWVQWNGASKKAAKNAQAHFSSSSKALADGLTELVQSLGGIVQRYVKQPTHQGGDGLTSYEVRVVLPSRFEPFRLARKRDEWLSGRTSTQREPVRRITSIEYVEDDEAVCITVANPDGLYVTNDFIVTHNSIFAENLVLSLAAGIPFLGEYHVDHPTRVLLLDRELSRSSLYERILELMKYRPGYRAAAPNLCVDHDHLIKVDRKGAYEVLEKLVTYNGVEVIVLDTAYKFFSQSMDSQTAMTNAFEVLDKLIHETGVSVVLTHHHKKSQNKNGKNEDVADPDNVAGSFLWTGWPNGTILLNYMGNSVENPFNAVCTFTAFRDAAPPEPLGLYRARDSLAYSAIRQFSFEDAPAISTGEKVKPTTEAVMEWLLTNVPVPEGNAMEELCRHFGVRETVVRPYLLDAMNSGYFRTRGRPPVIEYYDADSTETWEEERQLHLIPGGASEIENKSLIE